MMINTNRVFGFIFRCLRKCFSNAKSNFDSIKLLFTFVLRNQLWELKVIAGEATIYSFYFRIDSNTGL